MLLAEIDWRPSPLIDDSRAPEMLRSDRLTPAELADEVLAMVAVPHG
ncbi:hypothetical protein [Pseudonocardia adelaidensis]